MKKQKLNFHLFVLIGILCFFFGSTLVKANEFDYKSDLTVNFASQDYGVDEDDVIVQQNILYVLSLLDDKMNDHEKAMIIASYIQDGKLYKFTTYNQTYLGIFLEDGAVCGGYASAFELLAKAAGLSCETVTSSSQAHAWNVCKLDGEWTYIDTTKGINSSNYPSRYVTDSPNMFRSKSTYNRNFNDAKGFIKNFPEGVDRHNEYLYSSLVYYDEYYKYYIDSEFSTDGWKSFLYRENRTTKEKEVLDEVLYNKYNFSNSGLVKDEDKLYYIGTDKVLYSISTSGSNKTKIVSSSSSDTLVSVFLSNGYITYQTFNSSTKEEQLTQYKKLSAWPTIGSYTTSGDNYSLTYLENEESITILKPFGINGETPSGEIHIPNEINNKPVIAIADEAFDNTLNIYEFTGKIILPESLQSIGTGAFRHNVEITEVKFNDTLKSINSSAFAHCSALESIDIPDSVTFIGKNAFYNCKNIQSLKLGSGLSYISESAFEKTGFKGVLEIPENIEYISTSAFEDCTNVESFVLPKSLLEIGNYAFDGCSSLEDILIKSENIEYMHLKNVTADIYLPDNTITAEYANDNSINYIDSKTAIADLEVDSSNLTLYVNESPQQINYTITPKYNLIYPITFESSNPSIASVDSEGLITPKKQGTAVITIKNTQGLSAKVNVDVKKISFSLDHQYYQLNNINDTVTLNASLTNGEIPDVTWTSSNPKVATVDNDGKVIAKKGGFTYITATTAKYESVKCLVHVRQLVELVDKSKAYMGDIDRNGYLEENDYNLLEKSIDNFFFEYRGYAEVLGDVNEDGEINDADLTMLEEIYTSRAFTLDSYKPIINFSLNKEQLDLIVGEEQTLKLVFTPEDTTDSTLVNWISSDKKVATVDQNGKITALSFGTVEIYANTYYGQTAKCVVNVYQKATGIQFVNSYSSININESLEFKAEVIPNDAINQTINWMSSDPSILQIDSTGKATAISVGTATITAATDNGYKVTQEVIVLNPITKVSLNQTTATIQKGDTLALIATINPQDTTSNKTLTWTSSNPKVATVDNTGNVRAVGYGLTIITVKTSNLKTATATIYVPGGDSYLKGDMNQNGKIDLTDTLILIKLYFNKLTSNDYYEIVGDMNSNGRYDLTDILILIKSYFGKV